MSDYYIYPMNASFMKLLVYGLKGGAMATILSLVVFEIASRIFGLEFNVLIGGVPAKVSEVRIILASIVPSIIATVLYFILLKKTQKPDTIFKIMAAAALLLSLYAPFTQAQDLPVKLVLCLMHIIAAFEIVKSLVHDSKKSFSHGKDH